MVRLEDGEGLVRGARVVGALSGLDGLGHLGGAAGGRLGVFALGVGGCWVEGGQNNGRARKGDEEGCEVHLGEVEDGCDVVGGEEGRVWLLVVCDFWIMLGAVI